jgi:hypothetical protein
LQRRWQDGCRNLALVGSRLGVRYILYPRGFLTQPVGPVKRLSTFTLNSMPRSSAMAKKNKRPQAKKPQRASRPSGRVPPVSPLNPPVEPAAAAAAASPAPQPVARPVPAPRPSPRAARGSASAAALPPQDASIPLDRVPYFRADLRRIGITAGLMFVLLILGSIVLRNLLLA